MWSPQQPLGEGLVGYLVVQAETLTAVAPTVITLAVTDRAQRVGPPLALELEPGAGMWVKTTQVHTVPRDRLQRLVATASEELMAAVDGALVQLLALGSALV